MRLISSKSIEVSSVHNRPIDAIICALGYESRCTEFARKFSSLKTIKYVLAFENPNNIPQRIENSNFFKNEDYSIYSINTDGDDEILGILQDLSKILTKKNITICIDYSSMTSILYSSILRYFTDLDYYDNVNLLFSYSHAQYIPPQKSTIINRSIGPMKGFLSLTIPDKPTALIIGLGYEKGKAFGLTEYLDAETYIFYTEPEKHNEEFTADVEHENADLLAFFNKENIIKYPLYNLEMTQNLIYQVCSDLYSDYRIILAPCGPKPFTLLSLITSLKFENIDVWRISSGIQGAIYDRKANGVFSIIDCTLKR